jgi:hypothetical protein
MAGQEQAAPAGWAFPVGLEDWTFTTEDFKVTASTLLEVLAEVMEGIASVSLLARSRRELGCPGNRVAEPDSVRESTEVPLFVLALLLLSLAVFLTALLLTVFRVRCGPTLGGVIVDHLIFGSHYRLARSSDQVSVDGAVSIETPTSEIYATGSLLFYARQAFHSSRCLKVDLWLRGGQIELDTLGGRLAVHGITIGTLPRFLGIHCNFQVS